MKTMPTMPNFLVIGAAKSGTTAFIRYLNQHPQVFIGNQGFEPKFFSLEGQNVTYQGPGDEHIKVISDQSSYLSLFDKVSDEVAIGEKSPLYLYCERAPKQIKHYIPDVKLIALLRHPAERAFSSFLHLIREGREQYASFDRALEAEEERIRDNWWLLWHYRQPGLYYSQLKRYYETFSADQIKVCLYDDFCKNPQGFMKDVFEFLEIDGNYEVDFAVKHNVSSSKAKVPKNEYLHNLMNTSNPLKSGINKLLPSAVRGSIREMIGARNMTSPKLSQKTRGELIEFFREDILLLQDLIRRDLSAWLI